MKIVGAVRSVVCSILVLLLCVTSFTGCGKKNDAANSGGNETSVEPGKVDKNQIFKAEKIDGILAQGERIVCMECIGDRIKAFVSTEEEKDRCISFKPDGSDVQTFDVAIGEDYHSQYKIEVKGPLDSSKQYTTIYQIKKTDTNTSECKNAYSIITEERIT